MVLNPLYRRAVFALGAHAPSQFPPDTGQEVAFAGRSNAGKSSAINKITGQSSLARVSKIPGRTQQINFFTLDEQRRLVDLPGYGYAKVAHSMRQHWQHVMERYLRHRQALKGLVIVMDIRHPLTDFDWQTLELCRNAGLPAHLLLTKADKLSKSAAAATLQQVRHALNKIYTEQQAVPPTVQLFSALQGKGIEEAHAKLDEWLV
ncbi:MAG: ribosome biogenesis GTP-binding protein YihA/YsxC [Pseudomonadota bacterium]